MEQSQSNGIAVASMVLGIIALLLSCCYGGFLGIIGLILGIVAISKGQKKGMAVAGIITSVIALLITIIALAMGMSLMDEIANSNGDDVKKVTSETAGDNGEVSDSGSNVNNSSEETSSENIAESQSEYKVGDVIETKYVRISYISAEEYTSTNEFVQPKEGNVYYRMEFEFENISDSDQSVSSMIGWECYADGYSVDQSFVGDDDLSASLSSGKKARGALYFEVPNDAQEIVLEYNDNVWTSDKIVFVVK